MTFPATIWLLFAAALVISSIGFKNYVWFISLGYGFSIAGEGLLMLVLFRNGLTPGTVLCCAAFVLYGCRLGGYLAYRELKSTTYSKLSVKADACTGCGHCDGRCPFHTAQSAKLKPREQARIQRTNG